MATNKKRAKAQRYEEKLTLWVSREDKTMLAELVDHAGSANMSAWVRQQIRTQHRRTFGEGKR